MSECLFQIVRSLDLVFGSVYKPRLPNNIHRVLARRVGDDFGLRPAHIFSEKQSNCVSKLRSSRGYLNSTESSSIVGTILF